MKTLSSFRWVLDKSSVVAHKCIADSINPQYLLLKSSVCSCCVSCMNPTLRISSGQHSLMHLQYFWRAGRGCLTVCSGKEIKSKNYAMHLVRTSPLPRTYLWVLTGELQWACKDVCHSCFSFSSSADKWCGTVTGHTRLQWKLAYVISTTDLGSCLINLRTRRENESVVTPVMG